MPKYDGWSSVQLFGLFLADSVPRDQWPRTKEDFRSVYRYYKDHVWAGDTSLECPATAFFCCSRLNTSTDQLLWGVNKKTREIRYNPAIQGNPAARRIPIVPAPSPSPAARHRKPQQRVLDDYDESKGGAYEDDRTLAAQENKNLPLLEIEPSFITVVRDVAALEAAMAEMAREPFVGVDAEWRPNFASGHSDNPVAVIQVASKTKSFVIQAKYIERDPTALLALLANPAVIKVGCGIDQDMAKIRHRFQVHRSFHGTVDLTSVGRLRGYRRPGLVGLVAMFLGRRVTKGSVQRSNWENDPLTAAQITYAATDAWACALLYPLMMVKTSAYVVLYRMCLFMYLCA